MGKEGLKYYRINEFRSFPVEKRRYLFVVPNTAIAGMDGVAEKVIESLSDKDMVYEDALLDELGNRFSKEYIKKTIEGLVNLQVLVPCGEMQVGLQPQNAYQSLPPSLPMTDLVCHISHTCNMRCGYCYADSGRYGGEEMTMSQEMAQRHIDLLLTESGQAKQVQFTFFGGEPLLNFQVIKSTVEYARKRAKEFDDKEIIFSLTTNGTLFSDEIIRYITENKIHVTISIDGPKEVNDKVRHLADGTGSYDVITSRISKMLKEQRVPARVTLTNQGLNITDIVHHLLDVGFAEVGVSPVCSRDENYALSEDDLNVLASEFHHLSDEYLEKALRNEYFGFSNISNVLKVLHNGYSKNFSCGAGIRLYAGDASGNIYACHRLVGVKDCLVGNINDGINRDKQTEFLKIVHGDKKEACRSCWLRHLCAGGCHHFSFVHCNDFGKIYTFYCDWLRGWFEQVISYYVRLIQENPGFFNNFIESKQMC